jgi:hypothetical protein
MQLSSFLTWVLLFHKVIGDGIGCGTGQQIQIVLFYCIACLGFLVPGDRPSSSPADPVPGQGLREMSHLDLRERLFSQ